METEKDVTIPLIEERLHIDRRSADQLVSVSTVTTERQQFVDELLERELVDVSRVAVGRIVEVMPDIRAEGDTIIVPVVEEILVRRLFLREEVHIRKTKTPERHQETVNLRQQTAVVTRNSVASRASSADQSEDLAVLSGIKE